MERKRDKLYVKDENKTTKYLLCNDRKVGILHMIEDGYWYYSAGKTGLHSSHHLVEIANILVELNKDLDSILQDYFDNQSEQLDDGGEIEW